MRIIKQLTPYIPAAQIFLLFAHEKDCAFLDSSLVNQLGRYSILGLYPYLQLKKTKDAFTVNGKPETRQSFEEYLDAYLEAHREENTTDLPLVSGAIGYFSYDYGRKLQQIPSQQQKTVAVPDAVLTFYDVFLIEDCWNKQTFLVANGKTQPAQQLMETILAVIYESKTKCSDFSVAEKHCLSVRADFEQAEYEQAVRRMMDHMVAGDIYVANMTQQFEIHSTKSPVDVFLSLRKNNPSPFGAYMNCEDFQIKSTRYVRCFAIRRIFYGNFIKGEFFMGILLDDGFSFGLGAFETIAVEHGTPIFLEQHLQRLRTAAVFLQIDFSAAGITQQTVHDYLENQQEDLSHCALKVVLTPRNTLFRLRKNPYTQQSYQHGVSVDISSVRRNDTSPLIKYKTLNYGDCIIEKRAAAATGKQERIFLNTKGQICEGTVSNIFFAREGKIVTPPLSCGMLPGILRGFVCETTDVQEQILYPQDIAAFDECFVTNSLMGIMPVHDLDGIVFSSRAVSTALREKYHAACVHQQTALY